MTKGNKNVLDAKRSLKANVIFMEKLIQHLNSPNKSLRGHAMWAAWCLHRYFNEKLMSDIQDALNEHVSINEIQDA